MSDSYSAVTLRDGSVWLLPAGMTDSPDLACGYCGHPDVPGHECRDNSTCVRDFPRGRVTDRAPGGTRAPGGAGDRPSLSPRNPRYG